MTLIIGDGTALIGDPSRSRFHAPAAHAASRSRQNAATYMEQAHEDPRSGEDRGRASTAEWIASTLDLAGACWGLRSNFTVARILERDDFSKRYQQPDQPISLARVPLSRPCRRTIRSASRPTSSWAAPTSCSTCSPGASSWRRWAWSRRSA